jgi:hypothetical protein
MLDRIPVVAGLAYAERVSGVPSTFKATLRPEPDNTYFRHAIAVVVNGEKVGYVAPEVAVGYFEPLTGWTAGPVTCPGRRANVSDRETSGVELLLDFSSLPVQPLD